MKQLLQDLKDGNTRLEDTSIPLNKKQHLLICSKVSLVSSGTEKMLVDFGKASYLKKARLQPDKVKQVLEKVKTDGFSPTYEAVKSKLDQPIPLGYCNAGVVHESLSESFKVGDRVVSNGSHAEYVSVPKNLCAKIPDEVDDESASFTVIASVGLQGIRLLKPEIGETIVVVGLGLVGLISIQILKANGCNVIGIDIDKSRCSIAESFGATAINASKDQNPVDIALDATKGNGVDGVLITASSKSNDLMHQAASMCRKRGRIVLVGVVGLDLRRDDFYEKELTFQVSSSYGPGRYDHEYEEKGHDYPIGFVRWTEQRNFEAVLNMMKDGLIDMKPLISNIFLFSNAVEAYKLLDKTESLGILLDFRSAKEEINKESRIQINEEKNTTYPEINLGLIGAGNYASRVLMPIFKKANIVLNTIVSSGGVNSVHHGKNIGFSFASSDVNDIWKNDKINTVAIVTQHDTHAQLVISAIKANKNIFVEKPLAIKKDDIEIIKDLLKSDIKLMVGFNRRFAKHSIKLKELLKPIKKPKSIIMTINAGFIPQNHWTQDKELGGGRIIGEACHFIDLMRFYIGTLITSYSVVAMKDPADINSTPDKVTINLSFKDGSFGSIHYLSNGGPSFPKERIEVFCNNSIIQIDNFRKMKGYNWPGFKKMNLWNQDKGQTKCIEEFIKSIKEGSPSPIPNEEIFEVSKIAIDIAESIN
jgi:predicted dehydrogenase/threonine dehydrogenase-like Zn-dependent dehydrogenase